MLAASLVNQGVTRLKLINLSLDLGRWSKGFLDYNTAQKLPLDIFYSMLTHAENENKKLEAEQKKGRRG